VTKERLDQIRRAKAKACELAFGVYVQTLTNILDEEGAPLSLLELAETAQISSFLLEEERAAVAVTVEWSFSTDLSRVREVMKGLAPEVKARVERLLVELAHRKNRAMTSRYVEPLRKLAAEGVHGAEAGRRVGIGRGYAYRLAKAHGIKFPAGPVGAPRSPYIEPLRKLAAEGIDGVSAAERLGIHEDYARRLAARHGFPFAPRLVAKAITLDGIDYPSIGAAARALGVSKQAVSQRVALAARRAHEPPKKPGRSRDRGSGGPGRGA
jgi:hypothetical protein